MLNNRLEAIEKLNLTVFPSHDWRHCLARGTGVRHAALLSRMLIDPAFSQILWVSRVHPLRLKNPATDNADFQRAFVSPMPGGILYRVHRYAGTGIKNCLLLEHSLPHELDFLLAPILRRLAMSKARKALLWIGDPKESAWFRKLGERLSVFDAMDDWTLALQFAKKVSRIKKGYKKAKKADIICANTETAARRFEGHDDVRIIPNGADPYFPNEEQALPIKDRQPRPRLGLVGNYSDMRLNLDLLGTTLKAFPDAAIFLAGDWCMSPIALKMLKSHKHVIRLGILHNREVISLFAQLDLLLSPHTLSDYTESQDSITIYEAMTTGLAVISTSIHPAIDLANYCYIADDAKGWINAMNNALDENPRLKIERKQALLDHGWDSRYKLLRKALLK